MPLNVNQINDAEVQRQKRNLTESQKKNTDKTKEAVVVNALIRTPQNSSIDELYDSMIISADAKMPEKINENKSKREKSLLPISLISAGVMGTIALISFVVKKSAKANLVLKPTQKLPTLTRNLAINEEKHQAIYQMVQCPNQKTILAGTGVLAISAMGFMGKMFIDGFKEIWVKKQEASIQKDLQENLIAVETQSFSGKMQIIRSMLADKAKEFREYLCADSSNSAMCNSFGAKISNNEKQKQKSDDLKYFTLGIATLGTITGFGFIALKNLRSGKKYLEDYIKVSKDKISEIVKNSDFKTKQTDKINLKNILQAIDAEPEYIKNELSKLKWAKGEKESFIDETSFEVSKSTAQAEKALGGDGTPKPAFYSHVNDYRAFFYNWLLDTSNPLFRNLFFGVTGITALSYGGTVVGQAIKEVEVKKMNAQTELELQKKLVSTELRNFKAKKDAAIEPLCEEFYTQAEKGKPKEELKVMAENILFDVKNGPPFVYS